ncbi:MAG: hypothetical protein AAGA48_08845 [Myxococcota bacterium]
MKGEQRAALQASLEDAAVKTGGQPPSLGFNSHRAEELALCQSGNQPTPLLASVGLLGPLLGTGCTSSSSKDPVTALLDDIKAGRTQLRIDDTLHRMPRTGESAPVSLGAQTPGFEAQVLGDLKKMATTQIGLDLLGRLINGKSPVTIRSLDADSPWYLNDSVYFPAPGHLSGGRHTTFTYDDANGRPIAPESDSVLFGELLHHDLADRGAKLPGKGTDPVTGNTIDLYELQTHLGVISPGASPAGIPPDVLAAMAQHPTQTYLGPTENLYRKARGYRIRHSYEIN